MRNMTQDERRNPESAVDLHGYSRDDRKRLSGAALRTFAHIADEWGLSERKRIAVLGDPGRSTFHSWLAKARAGSPICLPLDTLLRLSAMLGIYKALKLIFPREGEDVAWLRAGNEAPTFGSQPPMDLITSGTQDGLLLVRRYLDAWRGGQAAGPIAGADFEQVPIADDELIVA